MSRIEESADPYAKQWKALLKILLVVLGVVALFMGVLLRIYWKAKPGSDLVLCKSNLSKIGTALEKYSFDHNGEYPASLDALVPKYVEAVPDCPAAGAQTYRAKFGPSAPKNSHGSKQYYYIECAGANHTRAAVKAGLPAFNGSDVFIEYESK